MNRPIRTLLFSTLYPSSVRPSHGIFVETRLRELLRSGGVETRVVAPVPWFPFDSPRFGDYASFARTPSAETWRGVEVQHPRYLLLPKVGMSSAPASIAFAAFPVLRDTIRRGFDFDVIDAHYFYPDGVAAVLLGRVLGKPVTITARGTDLNLIPQHALPRQMIKWAARHSAHMITVCQALKDVLLELGTPDDRVTVLRNGVDLALFRPEDRPAARARYRLTGFSLASVGHLIDRKGHDLVISALPQLPGVQLLIAGSGPNEHALRALAQALGVADRVQFLGSLPQVELCGLYNAADALVLASSREGWANVLLEAMACGTPVVASNVWGTPEVVATSDAGQLMHQRSADGVVQAVGRLRAQLPDRAGTRRYAEGFDWQSTTQGQLQIFRNVLPAQAQ